MLKKGCVITDILEKYEERPIEDKEIEMKYNFDKRKILPGSELELDKHLTKDVLT